MISSVDREKPVQLESWNEEQSTMAGHIRRLAQPEHRLQILEAGCGLAWYLDLEGVDYSLTGIDLDEKALDSRMNGQKDLDIAIHGDLTTIDLEKYKYDVIFSSYVLEHIDGAERVMERFLDWLKPGGIIILQIPNRDSARGFLTRITPFWFHVLFKKYFEGLKDAGKPGHAPYPTFMDEIVSPKGIREFCKNHCVELEALYSRGGEYQKDSFHRTVSRLLQWTVCLLSFGVYTVKNAVMIYVIQKPAELP